MQKQPERRTLTVKTTAIRELGDKELRRVIGCLHITSSCSGGTTATCTDVCSDYNTRFPP